MQVMKEYCFTCKDKVKKRKIDTIYNKRFNYSFYVILRNKTRIIQMRRNVNSYKNNQVDIIKKTF